jgi:hypothetical protein
VFPKKEGGVEGEDKEKEREEWREEVRRNMVGRGQWCLRTMSTRRQSIAMRTTVTRATIMTRVIMETTIAAVKTKDNSNQKTQEGKHLGCMTTSIGIGCQIVQLLQQTRE